MFFTKEDYKKIHAYLKDRAVKDTDLDLADPLNGSEIMTLVQNFKNVKIPVKVLINELLKLGVSDILNITSKYNTEYLTLQEAVAKVSGKARKKGQIITFLNNEGDWELYQFHGELPQWNTLEKWEKITDYKALKDITDLKQSVEEINNLKNEIKKLKEAVNKYPSIIAVNTYKIKTVSSNFNKLTVEHVGGQGEYYLSLLEDGALVAIINPDKLPLSLNVEAIEDSSLEKVYLNTEVYIDDDDTILGVIYHYNDTVTLYPLNLQ